MIWRFGNARFLSLPASAACSAFARASRSLFVRVLSCACEAFGAALFLRTSTETEAPPAEEEERDGATPFRLSVLPERLNVFGALVFISSFPVPRSPYKRQGLGIHHDVRSAKSLLNIFEDFFEVRDRGFPPMSGKVQGL